jgi:transposase/AraC-like DNA-binding protein/DNA-binding CsgD family transcriptional regulator
MDRANRAVEVSAAESEQLRSLARSCSLPHSLVRRARIVLMSAEGVPNQTIAARCGVSVPTISHWRRCWRERGVAGLHGELRPGRPRSYGDEQVAALMRKVLHSRPANATHWSVRTVAADTGMSKSTVARYFALFGGLYLNPPDKALVLCVDEKSQIQALERTQPVLPLGLGYLEGVTHDYYSARHHDLVCSAQRARWGRHHPVQTAASTPGVPGLLNHLDHNVPAELEGPLVADNYATHKHPRVNAWLARHRRFHLHYTPTYASWLNQMERWFALITHRAIRRGSFHSVRDLVQTIDSFVAHYNTHKRPFALTATADSILAKLQRLCKVINGTQH